MDERYNNILVLKGIKRDKLSQISSQYPPLFHQLDWTFD